MLMKQTAMTGKSLKTPETGGKERSYGVDGMPVESLRAHIQCYWASIRASIEDGTYEPMPVRRVEIPKPNGMYGGVRRRGLVTPSYSIGSQI
ncbi:hypothetical protein H1191_12025 [Paenactinomyces guangxiensis]|uniref:Uncharacterized protein n=1 Tax=Paenactinomyces guangxiensis TaxID=1490290 RepID=A0A7W1WS50_9BACL|nr:hypothetical protein [Paenactinomyces guangxiensis]MBA4495036.1 hypothetical protein [Paenactinomyces guangxiensis]MBH8592120.1 hypothetical protein [Paenactinomyces guangxiensis]